LHDFSDISELGYIRRDHSMSGPSNKDQTLRSGHIFPAFIHIGCLVTSMLRLSGGEQAGASRLAFTGLPRRLGR
jgi:hypothetical protein